MKFMKMLGLAAMAAMALMAFVASSASATELTSPAGTMVPTGTTIEATLKSGTTALLTNTEENLTLDTCTGSDVTGVTSNTGGATETVKGSLEPKNVLWTNCTHPTTTIKGGTLEIHVIGTGPNGTLTASGIEVEIKETGIGTCIYTAGTGVDLGTLTGGEPAIMDINAVVNKAPGSAFLCPSDGRWVATYVVTKPNPLFVS